MQLPALAQAAAIGAAFAPGMTAEQLRALSADRVIGALNIGASLSSHGRIVTRPTFPGSLDDGRTMLGIPLEAARAGLDVRVPLLIRGNTADGIPSDADKSTVFKAFGPQAAEARALYDPTGQAPAGS